MGKRVKVQLEPNSKDGGVVMGNMINLLIGHESVVRCCVGCGREVDLGSPRNYDRYWMFSDGRVMCIECLPPGYVNCELPCTIKRYIYLGYNIIVDQMSGEWFNVASLDADGCLPWLKFDLYDSEGFEFEMRVAASEVYFA